MKEGDHCPHPLGWHSGTLKPSAPPSVSLPFSAAPVALPSSVPSPPADCRHPEGRDCSGFNTGFQEFSAVPDMQVKCFRLVEKVKGIFESVPGYEMFSISVMFSFLGYCVPRPLLEKLLCFPLYSDSVSAWIYFTGADMPVPWLHSFGSAQSSLRFGGRFLSVPQMSTIGNGSPVQDLVSPIL